MRYLWFRRFGDVILLVYFALKKFPMTSTYPAIVFRFPKTFVIRGNICQECTLSTCLMRRFAVVEMTTTFPSHYNIVCFHEIFFSWFFVNLFHNCFFSHYCGSQLVHIQTELPGGSCWRTGRASIKYLLHPSCCPCPKVALGDVVVNARLKSNRVTR